MKHDEIEKLYDEVLALDDRIERKGKSMPYTSVNGHMFSFVSKPEGDRESFVAVRLSEKGQKAFIDEFGTGPVIQHGATMRGYVEMPNDLLADTPKTLSILQQSYDYISSLPPKPTKK